MAAPDGATGVAPRAPDDSRDDVARRRGQAVLGALSALQRDLLGVARAPGRSDGAHGAAVGVGRLATAAREAEEAARHAADPRLRHVLGELAVRAAVELARRGGA